MVTLPLVHIDQRKKITHVAVSAQYHGELLRVVDWHPSEGAIVDTDLGLWGLQNYLAQIPYYQNQPNVEFRWLSLHRHEVEHAMRLYHYPSAAVVTLSSGEVCPQQVFSGSPASAVRLRQSGIAQGLRISNACQRVSDLGAIYIEGRDAESECQVFDCGIYHTHPAGYTLWNGRADYVNAGIHVDDGARAIISGCVISDCEVGILINGHYDGLVSDVTITRCDLRDCQIPIVAVGPPKNFTNPTIIRTDIPFDRILVKSGWVEFEEL